MKVLWINLGVAFTCLLVREKVFSIFCSSRANETM